MKKTNNG